MGGGGDGGLGAMAGWEGRGQIGRENPGMRWRFSVSELEVQGPWCQPREEAWGGPMVASLCWGSGQAEEDSLPSTP